MIQLLNRISFGIGFMGVVVIVWGTLITTAEFFPLEVFRLRGRNICLSREFMRHHYGSYILLGLEFLIAADIVHTMMQPDLAELAGLGAIVSIRTVLSFFLNREMATHTFDSKASTE